MKDNLGVSLIFLGRRLDSTWDDRSWWVREILASPERCTWLCSLIFLLPLCMMLDMTPLANFSLLSITLMATLTSIVLYLFVMNPNDEIRQPSDGIYVDWIQIRSGFLESLGTFVFAFVSQHTAHLTFSSIRPVDRTLPNFAQVTTWSIATATTLTLMVGSAVYMSFWKKAGKVLCDAKSLHHRSVCILHGLTDSPFTIIFPSIRNGHVQLLPRYSSDKYGKIDPFFDHALDISSTLFHESRNFDNLFSQGWCHEQSGSIGRRSRTSDQTRKCKRRVKYFDR